MRLEYDIIIHKKDDVYFQIECERSIAKELNEYFSFEVPGAKFMPHYQKKYWDGKIRLFSTQTGDIYVGLLDRVVQFSKDLGYTYEF